MKQVILSLMSDEFPVKIQTSINISMPISPDKKYFGTLNCIRGGKAYYSLGSKKFNDKWLYHRLVIKLACYSPTKQ